MKILVRSLVVLLLIGSALNTGFAQSWLPQTPSFLLKLLPKPKFEKHTLEGSGENGRVIDLQGGWLNEGNLAEMVPFMTERDSAGRKSCIKCVIEAWADGFMLRHVRGSAS